MLYTLSNDKPVQVVSSGDSPTLIVNRDLINSIVYGPQSIAGSNINALALIDPLGSVSVDGTQDVYLLAASGTPIADVVTGAFGWSPSPAQTAAQIAALGLARDSSVLSVNTTLGVPAQTTDINNVNTTLAFGTNPNIQTLGGGVGSSIATDMLFNNKNVTGQLAALIASGSPSGTPGGVPLLRGTDNLGFANGISIPAATTTTLLNTVAVTAPGFEAIFQLNNPISGTATVPYAIISVLWTDSNTGLLVGQKSYIVGEGDGPTNAITCYLSGPCRGNQITLKISNQDPSVACTLTWALNITGHVYLVDRFLQPTYPTNPPHGQTQGGGNPSKGLLFTTNPSIAASGSLTRQTAASNVRAKLSVDNGGQANGLNITLTTPSTVTLYNEVSAGQVLYRLNTAAGAGNITEIQMPNGPLNVNMINQGASIIQPSVTIIAEEY